MQWCSHCIAYLSKAYPGLPCPTTPTYFPHRPFFLSLVAALGWYYNKTPFQKLPGF